MEGEDDQSSPLADPHISLDACLNSDATEHDPLAISTCCEKCQEDLDGPCYEHTDVKRIIFDKPPVPLAHSSLPDALGIGTMHPLEKEQVIFAKQKIEARTLFGPLIAPLVPLDEGESGPLRYTMWLEETRELQVYDLSDDFLCNWIKFIRPSASLKEANVIAYQQRGSVYLVAVRDILPSTEMRVYVKMPRSSSVPNYQLSLFVQSLLASYDGEKLEGSRAVDVDPEIMEKPAPKRKKSTRRKRTKVVAAPEESLTSNEVEKRRPASPDISAVMAPSNAEEEPQPMAVDSIQPMSTKRVSREWSLLNKRFKSGDMTEDEKRNFENDERTIEQRKKEEGRKKITKQKKHLRVANMTKEERKVYLEKKRVANVRNAPNNNTEYRLLREKFVTGLTLTPEELLRYEKRLERRRQCVARNKEKRRLALIAEGKDPDARRQSGGYNKPMFEWQIAQRRTTGDADAVDTEAANAQPVEERTSGGRRMPAFRLKIRQGIPLTSEDEAAYQRYLTRNREDNRAYYGRRKIAKGLKPKEVPSRRKASFEKRKNVTDGNKRKSKDDAGSSSEVSNDGSDSQEA